MLASVTPEDCKALKWGVGEDSTEGHLQRPPVVGVGGWWWGANASADSGAQVLSAELLEWGWAFTWGLVTDSSVTYSFVT